MKNFSMKGGLFARQKTIDKIRKVLNSIRDRISQLLVVILMAGLFTSIASCNDSEGQNYQKEQSKAAKDTLNQPKVNIKVNKRYDDKGNLIGMDSTYTSYFSNVKGDTVNMDSLIRSFDRYFRHHSSFLYRPFDSIFFYDSLPYPDFFHDDYFMKRFEMNDKYFRDAMRQMDSIKNRFFYDQSKKWKEDIRDL